MHVLEVQEKEGNLKLERKRKNKHLLCGIAFFSFLFFSGTHVSMVLDWNFKCTLLLSLGISLFPCCRLDIRDSVPESGRLPLPLPPKK